MIDRLDARTSEQTIRTAYARSIVGGYFCTVVTSALFWLVTGAALSFGVFMLSGALAGVGAAILWAVFHRNDRSGSINNGSKR